MRLILTVALSTLMLSASASAQTRVITAHAETASALKCLLDHGQNGCRQGFAGSARPAATYWLWWTPEKDFKLGAPVSSGYVGTEAVNAYITKYVGGRTADVYDVRFQHYKKNFYVVPPGPDGKVHFMNVRGGEPDDEKLYLFAGPG